MNHIKNFSRTSLLSIALIFTGVLMGLLLSLLASWADYEASSYGFMRRAQASFQGLVCPIFLGKNESGTVSIKVHNPTDRPLSPGVWTEISTPTELDSQIDYIQVAPGGQTIVRRLVGSQNIDLGMFIFVDAMVYSAYPLPDRENTCGILVLPLSKGAPILIIATVLSLLFMTMGMFSLYKNELPARRPRTLLFMVLGTLLAILLSFIGWWMQAILMIVLMTLMFVITLGMLLR